MARPSKKYEKGEGGKYLHVILDPEDIEALEYIKSFLGKKYDRLGVKGMGSDAAATRSALRHYAEHVKNGDIK